jgi:hypothetical protein
MKIELGPVCISRIVGQRVKRQANGSLDMDVVWEDEVEGKNVPGTVHIHEREVRMIMANMGRRDINGGYRG